MSADEGNDDRRVDEDERVRDDYEWRALDLAARQMLATLLPTREVIAALEQEA